MANVLTLADKMVYKRIRMLRFVIVLSGVVVLVSMVGIAALIPAFMHAQNVFSDAQLRAALTKSEENTTARETLNARSLLLRKQIEMLNTSYTQQSLSVLYTVLSIAKTHANDIRITRISFGLINGDETLSVAGTARTRDALDSFGRALKKDPATARADIPVSLLADSTGIEFSIPITLVLNKN